LNHNTIIVGNFYFIEDKYFEDFPDLKLMSNKDSVQGKSHDRACFYALYDSHNGLYWFIPISSQVEKYQKIYDAKLKKQGSVDTIIFGFVMGNKRAFLIQNMFPIRSQYIKNEYIDTVSRLPVTVNEKLKRELEQKSKKVLLLQRKGFPLIFPDVLSIEQQIIASDVRILVAPTDDTGSQ